jgi:hypothetical protein
MPNVRLMNSDFPRSRTNSTASELETGDFYDQMSIWFKNKSLNVCYVLDLISEPYFPIYIFSTIIIIIIIIIMAVTGKM